MWPIFNCSNATAPPSTAALVVSALVYTSLGPPLPCPNATATRAEVAASAGIANCTVQCGSDYALAQAVANLWAPDAVPPPLIRNVATGLVFSDIVLLLLVTAVVGLVFFAVLGSHYPVPDIPEPP